MFSPTNCTRQSRGKCLNPDQSNHLQVGSGSFEPIQSEVHNHMRRVDGGTDNLSNSCAVSKWLSITVLSMELPETPEDY